MNAVLKIRNFVLLFVLVMTFSCKDDKSVTYDPPIKGLEPQFTEFTVNPLCDSTYTLSNGTTFCIPAGSLLDDDGNEIKTPVKMFYCHLEDATSIFLAGMPMQYFRVSKDMALQTAGMFEIKGTHNGKPVKVNSEKPIIVTVGSNFTDPRQGFFKLDEKSGDWLLTDIPTVKINEDKGSLRTKLANLKKEVRYPLGPQYYVFDFTRMADVFLGDDYERIHKANLKVLAKKMESYGAKSLSLNFYPTQVSYKGNKYGHSELLWKADSVIKAPKWVRDLDGFNYYDSKTKKSGNNISIKKIAETIYEFHFDNLPNGKDTWSMKLEVVSHLRYMLKYTPEQLVLKTKQIDDEIEETERKIRQTKLIEYTANLYGMGVYNCDRPILYSPGRPNLSFMMDGKDIKVNDIKNVAIFNSNLTSVSYPISYNPVICPFFKGIIKLVLITKDGTIGLLNGKEYSKIVNDKILQNSALKLPLVKINPKDEAELRALLLE